MKPSRLEAVKYWVSMVRAWHRPGTTGSRLPGHRHLWQTRWRRPGPVRWRSALPDRSHRTPGRSGGSPGPHNRGSDVRATRPVGTEARHGRLLAFQVTEIRSPIVVVSTAVLDDRGRPARVRASAWP